MTRDQPSDRFSPSSADPDDDATAGFSARTPNPDDTVTLPRFLDALAAEGGAADNTQTAVFAAIPPDPPELPVTRLADNDGATRIIPVFRDPPPPPPPAARPMGRRGRTVALHRTRNSATRADALGLLRFRIAEWGRDVADRIRHQHGRQRGRRRLKVISTVAAFILAAAVTGGVWYLAPDKGDPTHASATDWAPGSAGGRQLAANLFAGTPAQSFPEGTAGLIAPPARPLPGWPSQQVAAGISQVTQALIETRIAPALVRDHNPDNFLNLIAPRQRDTLRTELDNGKSAAYASQLANGVQLVGNGPRVKGTFSYRATVNKQSVAVLEVESTFVWVYPIAPSAGHPDGSLIVVHDRITWQVTARDSVSATDAGLWLGDAESYASNIDCGLFSAGLLAPSPTAGSATEPADLFNPGAPLAKPTCT